MGIACLVWKHCCLSILNLAILDIGNSGVCSVLAVIFIVSEYLISTR